MLPIGMISMAFGILIEQFVHIEVAGFAVSDFAEGIIVRILDHEFGIFDIKTKKGYVGVNKLFS